MNARTKSHNPALRPVRVPVDWQLAAGFYPKINISRNPLLTSSRATTKPSWRLLPRPAILTTAVIMALVFLTAKPCGLRETSERLALRFESSTR